MLSICDRASRYGRRDFLRIGSLALGGLTLPGLLRMADAEQKRVLKGRSVIFLFLHGGPSQVETFDPKMTAPEGVRSTTGELSTSLPGITFGGTFPKLASLAHKFSVVRSYASGTGNHDIKPIVCKDTLMANMGSLYARVAGTNHPQTGLPTNTCIFPRAVDDSTGKEQENFGKFTSSGQLGSAFAPFVPGAGGDMQKNMQLSMDRGRLDDRRNLLAGLDRIRRDMDEQNLGGLDRFQEQAFTTIVGGAADAFDLAKEDPALVARYDTAPLVRPNQISSKWKNYNHYVDNAKSLGKLMLLARRLCEAGCGFVTVTTNFVWDMHADVNNAPCEEGMQYMGVPLDHALSTFIEDVESRGLRDKILLVVSGEMGRTPKVNKNGGRDHWGNITPLLLYGGGLNMGQVIGQSTRDAGEPATEPYGIPDLLATVMHSVIDVGQLRIDRSAPGDVLRALSAANPIPGLV